MTVLTIMSITLRLTLRIESKRGAVQLHPPLLHPLPHPHPQTVLTITSTTKLLTSRIESRRAVELLPFLRPLLRPQSDPDQQNHHHHHLPSKYLWAMMNIQCLIVPIKSQRDPYLLLPKCNHLQNQTSILCLIVNPMKRDLHKHQNLRNTLYLTVSLRQLYHLHPLNLKDTATWT